MKRLISLTITLLLSNLMLNAQIVLDHIYPVPPDQTFPGVCRLVNGGEKWFIPDVVNHRIDLYNLDYTLFKTINIPAQPNQYFGVMYITDKLFNLDAAIEYMVVDFYQTRVMVYNEDGSIIFAEGDSANPAKVSYAEPVVNTAGGTKMVIGVESLATGANVSKIYTLPGSLPNSQSELGSQIHGRSVSNVFPNPNDGHTRIDYQLMPGESKGQISFYNLQGKPVKSFATDGPSGSLEIDNSDLPAGTYLYQICTGRNRSETKKMILIR
ncbi:MAG: T9SS type A sorting domain-containing protein [Bacteroidota bacterium]